MASAHTGRNTIVICFFLAVASSAGAADHLLISEVVVTPTAGEFVESFNPTDTAIDLSDVYLTDATYATGGTYYYNLVTGANAGGGDISAFEGDGGTVTFSFTISLTQAALTGGVSLDISTEDGTATVAGLDYTEASDTQVIPQGASSEVFHVEVIGDVTGEINEEFLVVIAKPGDTYSATGPLAYQFGDYEIWASEPVDLTSGPTVVVPVRPAAPTEMTIASLNMFRFYDDIDDPGIQDDIASPVEYLIRRTKFRRYILKVLRAPDVIGLQEIEKLDILLALAADIEAEDPSVSYSAHLVPGNIIYGMNVGYLVRDTVESVTVTQLGFDDILIGWGYKLFDHPPLLIEGTWVGDGSVSFDFAALNNHTRSLSGVDEPFDDFAREKRFQQAQSIAQKVQDFQTAEPNTPLVLIGDYNAFEFTDDAVPDRSLDHDGMVLYLDTASVLFADGFEPGDTTRWSSATR